MPLAQKNSLLKEFHSAKASLTTKRFKKEKRTNKISYLLITWKPEL